MRTTVQVAYIFMLMVRKDSFCHRGKSKLGIGLFIHELLREPLIIIQIEYTANKNRQSLSQPKPWCNDSGVLHHDNDVKEVVSSQPSVTWYKSTNQKIGIRTVYEICGEAETERRIRGRLTVINAHNTFLPLSSRKSFIP